MALPLDLAPEVADAISSGRPVVALESTIISHGLPFPENLVAARRFEALVRENGAVPATIAVVDGRLKAGLTSPELERLADGGVPKLTVRDLPVVLGRGGTGGTTVAATAFVADLAGIRVFATGGLGGVHRGASETFDESADLKALSEIPIVVVSAGVKSILDVPATLERLETLGVTVVGYGTDEFPGFWRSSTGERLDWRVDDPRSVAAIMEMREELELCSAVLVANPVPVDEQLDEQVHDNALADALEQADKLGLSGKEVTPFLLAKVVELTGGESLRVNLRLVEHNVRVASAIAVAWAATA